MQRQLSELKGVVFINQSLSFGGAENFSDQLLLWFKKRGVPVKAWVTLASLNKKLRTQGIESRKIAIVVDIIGDWKGLLKGIALFPFAALYYGYLTFKNRNSGTFLVTGYIEKIVVTPWAKFFRVPIVWIEFGPLQPVFSKFFGLPKVLYRLVSKLPDYVIEPSENTRKSNESIAGFSSALIKIIPCGIGPLQMISAIPKELTAYCVSRMEPGKGQDLLITAWPEVIARYPSAHLYFIGGGDFRQKLEKQVSDLKLKGSVTFLGWVKDVARTVASLSVAVFPTVWPLEGMSLVFMEAMSIGKPIVCFKWGSNLELVTPKCAIMVEKGNSHELAQGICQAFSQPTMAAGLGLNAKKRFNKLFNIDIIAPKYEAVLIKAQND